MRENISISMGLMAFTVLSIIVFIPQPAYAFGYNCSNPTYFDYKNTHILQNISGGNYDVYSIVVNETANVFITLKGSSLLDVSFSLQKDGCDKYNLCSSNSIGNLDTCSLTLYPGEYYAIINGINGSGDYYFDFDLNDDSDYRIVNVKNRGSFENMPGSLVNIDIAIERILDTSKNSAIEFVIINDSGNPINKIFSEYAFDGGEIKIFNINFTVPGNTSYGKYSLGIRISESGLTRFNVIKYDLFEVLYVLTGDVNHDNKVNIFDMATVGISFGSSVGDDDWIPGADINIDGKINIFDMASVGIAFGNTCGNPCVSTPE